MTLSNASLTELVAELRERLRHFAAGPPGGAEVASPAGPLEPSGRATLAARLLAVVVGARQGPDAAAAAKAFEGLADVLDTAPRPLPGSAWEADLKLLAREFETLAGAWDSDNEPVLVATWRSLRAVGDRLWAQPLPQTAAAPSAVAAADPAPAGEVVVAEVWLLTAGLLRRTSLRQRLVAAGLKVDCPEDIEAVTRRLVEERPAALICDDAAPTRYHSRLVSCLPASAPPVILVRSRTIGLDPAVTVWLPPYDTDELLGRLGA